VFAETSRREQGRQKAPQQNRVEPVQQHVHQMKPERVEPAGHAVVQHVGKHQQGPAGASQAAPVADPHGAENFHQIEIIQDERSRQARGVEHQSEQEKSGRDGPRAKAPEAPARRHRWLC
jgi:hypothetical protein